MTDDATDQAVRNAAFEFLDQQVQRHGEVLPWRTLTQDFLFNGIRVPLLGAAGIWKPAILDLPISITTAPPKSSKEAPYDDGVRSDGLLTYRYRGDSPSHPDNVRLREAFRRGVPVVYFLGIDKGLYRPFWPTVIVEDHPADLHIAVALYEGAVGVTGLGGLPDDQLPEKSYARRLTLQRLHQPAFRERVLRAYQRCCAVCRLKHAELLDAAHILPDSHARGLPVVTNGLALCKIHHAAFDAQILGVRPDHVIEVRADILEEVDGPMLRYGLQEMHGGVLHLPKRLEDRPDPTGLEERYELFRAAG